MTKTNSEPRAKGTKRKPDGGGPALPSAFERELPHALDAERAVLGSMLLEESAIGSAITVLGDAGPDAFWAEKHRRLFAQMVELWKASRPMDGVVIKDELVRSGHFEQLGGYDFLAELVNSVPSALRINDYAQIVREKYLLRQLIAATHGVLETAFADNQPAGEILDTAEKQIFTVTERRVTSDSQSLATLIEDVFRQIEKLDGRMLTGEATGFYQLDELTSGFQPAELIIVAGRPSMGKTALGLNIAEHMALVEGHPVLFFSLEMSRQQVAQRILCSRARVDSHRLRRGMHSTQELQLLQQVAEEIQHKPLFIDDTSSLSILEMRARARMAFRRHKIQAIFVDYLQLARAPGAESRQQEVAEISRGLKALAKELNVPVVAMAQLNRNPEDRSGNRPRMSDLRESGAIEQDADLIALLHREGYFKDQSDDHPDGTDSEAELIIAKQRNGPVGTVKLQFNRRSTRFENPASGGRYSDVPEAQLAGPG